MYKRILIPVDGSLHGEHAVRLGVNLARKIGAHPILLHVAREPVVNLRQDFPERAREHGLDLLKREREHARHEGAPPDTRFELSRNVPETIVRVAEEEQCDLIVMGSHQHSELEEAILGSVTERVVRLAKMPVLIEREWRAGGSGV